MRCMKRMWVQSKKDFAGGDWMKIRFADRLAVLLCAAIILRL